jgi:hypothetical protein
MKSFLPLLSLTLVFASCSSAYKTGQTPDDVYYSPERPQEEYVRVDKDDEDRYYGGDQDRNSSDYYNYEEDRYLRMKVRNRSRWSYLDNDFYSYNPYVYNNYSYYYNSPWNSYSYWDHCYNPYSRQVIIYNPKTITTNRPRTVNLRTFDNPQNTGSGNTKSYNSRTNTYNTNNSYSAPRRNVGNELRNIFNSGSSSSSSYPSSSGGSSSRTSTNSSSSSSSSSGSSSSGGSDGGSRGNATRGR